MTRRPRVMLLSQCFYQKAKKNESVWYIDSGASAHMTPNGDILLNKKTPLVAEIRTANNTSIQVASAGDSRIDFDGKKGAN